MRILSSPAHAASLFALHLSSLLAGLGAQEPTPTPPAPAAQPAPEAAAPPTAPEAAPEGARRPRPRRQPIVIEAGTVHPVGAPAIQNGVVVIRGERIVAVGKQGEVELPPNAIVRSFPTGHVYPGLIDAQTDAFTDNNLRSDGEADGGSSLADDLRPQHDRSDELVAAGITTAYVTVRSPALVRGQGAIVRPSKDGFEVWAGRERAALQMRLTNGPGPSHALQRQQQLQAADGLFEGLDEFRKARTDHDEAVKKYDKEFADYLTFHQKKKDGDKKPDAKPESKSAADAPAPAAGAPSADGPLNRGNRGGPGREEPPKKDPPKHPESGATPAEIEFEQALATLLDALPQDPVKQEPPKQEPPKPGETPAPGAASPAPEKKDEGPKRPTYPKAPGRDPQREALLKVLDGELPLRVEAHRTDEVRAALRMQREREIPQLVIEQAYGAATLANELAAQGVSVVLTEQLAKLPSPYDRYDAARLPAQLQAAGVPFALATGSARHAALLPLCAAAAIGGGLSAEAALSAITLTPAEILGINKDTGSLAAGKYADVLVCDRSLFGTDSHVLLVLSRGRTEFEAK